MITPSITSFGVAPFLPGEKRREESSSRTSALPVVELPPHSIKIAESHGIELGLKELLTSDPEKNAAYVITLFEKLHGERRCAGVGFFLNTEMYRYSEPLTARQKAEFMIRTAWVLYEGHYSDPMYKAVEALETIPERPRGSKETLKKLALMFAERGDVEKTIKWLMEAGVSKEECLEAVRIFFRQDRFNQAGELLEAFDCLTLPMGEWRQMDYLRLLGYGLKDSNLLNSYNYQEALIDLAGSEENRQILLTIFCLGKFVERGLELAKRMAFEKKEISPLLQAAKLFRDNTVAYDQCKKVLKETANHLPDPNNAYSRMIVSGFFTLSESLELVKCYDNLPLKLASLKSLVVYNSSPVPNKEALKNILSLTRLHLSVSTVHEAGRLPSHWMEVLHECIAKGFYEEALKTGVMFKKWYNALSERDKEKTDAFYFLSTYGILELSLGGIEVGRSDLEIAHQIQEKETAKGCHPESFAYYVKDAIEKMYFSRSRDNFFRRQEREMNTLRSEAFKPLAYQTIPERVKRAIETSGIQDFSEETFKEIYGPFLEEGKEVESSCENFPWTPLDVKDVTPLKLSEWCWSLINPRYRSLVARGAAIILLGAKAAVTPWKISRIWGAVVLTAALYGVAHHFVAYRVCPEYFTVGHQFEGRKMEKRLVTTLDPKLNAVVWGGVSTVTVAALAGALLSVGASLRGVDERALVVNMVVYALCSFIVADVTSRLVRHSEEKNPIRRDSKVPDAFQPRWQAVHIRNTIAYASLGMGVMALALVTRKTA